MKISSFKKAWASIRVPAAAIVLLSALSGCKDNAPEKEDVPELITKVTLTFIPADGGSNVVVTATDPDGEGVQSIKMDGPISLAANKTYTMKIDLINGLADPKSDAYTVTNEVRSEGHEHQFFFSWDKDAFSNPSGNGNIDNRSDPLNYSGGADSKDENGRPLGLTTTWTTAANSVAASSFRVLLKHQPELKSDTSDSSTGETDLDVTFTLNIQ